MILFYYHVNGFDALRENKSKAFVVLCCILMFWLCDEVVIEATWLMILNNLLKKLLDSYQGFIVLCVFNWKFNSTVHLTVN